MFAGFEKADLEILVQRLRKLYDERRRYLQASLDGTLLLKPAPVLNLFGRSVRGIPVDESRIRVLEPIPHAKLAVAVDASAKVLFNLGSAVIVESKAVALAYRGFRRVAELQLKRVALVGSKAEAAEWLLRVEYETALSILHSLGGNGYLLMDRSLTVSPLHRATTRELVGRVERRALAAGLVPVGLPKRTRLALDTGESLLGYVASLAEKLLRNSPWFYYPVFRLESLPPWILGAPAVAKLSEVSGSVLRVDVSRKALARFDCEGLLGELAFLQDASSPGYPYPLKAAHEASKISESEVELDRMAILEALGSLGIRERLLLDAAASASFKERSLWGDTF